MLAGTVDVRFEGAGLLPGQVNLAYGLHPAWRGRGLATRAVLLAARYAAREGGAQAVIQVDRDNPASAAVARRAGFTPAAPVPRADGAPFDRYVRELRAAAPRVRRLLRSGPPGPSRSRTGRRATSPKPSGRGRTGS
ncbi:GNAT family N-acetyltransferase [Streptomyces manipurensis]|uniref:GNAT family N-acetyltransferase n=1 Tax=Streptomyces manipurensis TaxID=1077945 RepID=UPI003C6EF79B